MALARSQFSVVLAPLALLAGFSLFWFGDTIADPDLWGHIRFGQDILRTGSIVATDIYSYRTGGHPWINHEWLSEVIFAGLYNQSGPVGLIIFKVLVSLLILGLSYAHLSRQGLGSYSSVFLLLVMSIPFRLGLGTIRPQIFTYLFFFFELLILEEATAAHPYWLWMLPILLAVWVNLHGGVLAGAGLIGIWIVVRLVLRPAADARGLKRYRETRIRLTLVGFACGLALLLNPYRADLVGFLLRTATASRPEISEWAPLQLMSIPGQVYLVLLAIGISALVWSGRRREPEAIAIFSVAARAPFDRQPTLSTLCTDAHRPGRRARRGRLESLVAVDKVSIRSGRWTAVVTVLASLVLIGLSLPRFGCIRVDPFLLCIPGACRRTSPAEWSQREHGGPFRLGRVRPLASRTASEGLDRRQARDRLLRRELSAVARLRERERGLGCVAQDRHTDLVLAPDRLIDGQLAQPD